MGTTSDTDLFTFTAAGTGTATIALDPNAYDGAVSIYSSAGTRLAWVNAMGVGRREVAEVWVDRGQSYFVCVSNTGSSTGTYILTVQSPYQTGGGSDGDVYEPDNQPSDAAEILPNDVWQRHSLHVSTDLDWVKFTLATVSSIQADVWASSGDTEMWLYSGYPSDWGRYVAYADNGNGTTSHPRISKSGLPAGTYYLAIQSRNQGSSLDA
jgi:hypothetical protein